MLLTFWRNPLPPFSAWKSKSGEATSFLPCNVFSGLFSSPLAGSQFRPIHFGIQCLYLRAIPTLFSWKG
jgi:hypothetical protein